MVLTISNFIFSIPLIVYKTCGWNSSMDQMLFLLILYKMFHSSMSDECSWIIA